jgi:3-isopropylmalate/(R)-2-methylmalate dehydratase small subunit
MNEIFGNAYLLGDDINTDDIVPSYTLTMRDANEMAKHALEYIDPNFAEKASKNLIIVAGHNFGTGSSREEAVNVFKILGIRAIIAKSFSRIYFRNLINNGMMSIICDWDEKLISNIDELKISIENGKIYNETKKINISFKKLPPFLKEIIESGGILNQLKEKLTSD